MDTLNYTLGTEEIAKKLGYHVQYVRFLAASSKIPALKRGRKWLFNEQEVLEFFKSQTPELKTPTPQKEHNNDRRKDDNGADLLR